MGEHEQFSQEGRAGEVFSVLGNETRLAILRTLWEADDRALPFSELYDGVEIDDSGQFSYHLDKLVGQFVTDTDGGYRLTQAARHVNGAIASGTYTAEGTIDPIALDAPCRMCGGNQHLEYDTEIAKVECNSCTSGWEGTVAPAVLAGRDREAIPAVVSDHLRTQFRRIATGFCTYCSGETVPTVGPLGELSVGADPEEDDQADAGRDGDSDQDDPAAESGRPVDHVAVEFECRRCGHRSGLSLDYALLLVEPEVELFFYEQGIPIRDRRIWNAPELDPENTELVRREPMQARVTFPVGDATLAVTVDEDLSVVDVERER